MTGPSQLVRPWLPHTYTDPAETGRLNAMAAEVAKLLDSEEQETKRVATVRGSLTLAEEYDKAFEAAQRTRYVMALPRRRWSDVKAEHPARKVEGDDGESTVHEDDSIGVNTATFFDAVMHDSIVTEDGTPQYPDADKCAEATDELSSAEWSELCSIVWLLNERGVGVPKSSMASRVRERIGESSDLPETSESPSRASTAGSRVGGPITTTQTAS